MKLLSSYFTIEFDCFFHDFLWRQGKLVFETQQKNVIMCSKFTILFTQAVFDYFLINY